MNSHGGRASLDSVGQVFLFLICLFYLSICEWIIIPHPLCPLSVNVLCLSVLFSLGCFLMVIIRQEGDIHFSFNYNFLYHANFKINNGTS